MSTYRIHLTSIGMFICLLLTNTRVWGQAEVQAWGNITGIRVEGQLLRFESSLRVVSGEAWDGEQATGRERNWATYRRKGAAQIVRTHMDSLFFVQTVQDLEPGKVRVKVEYDPKKDKAMAGAFFHLSLPENHFRDADIRPMETAGLDVGEYTNVPVGDNEIMRIKAGGIRIKAEHREMIVTVDEPLNIIVKSDPETGEFGIYFTIQAGQGKVGEGVTRVFDISASGTSEVKAARLKVFPEYPGNPFLGLGGNFRLQNAKTDPQVIDYCLENLDVRMGRVEMPWQLWHPVDTVNPLNAARNGDLHPRVQAAMEMAQRLYKMGMPVLLATWFPPDWAAEGVVKRNPRNPDGTYGNPLRQDRMAEVYASITSYILYLKEAYGVDIAMFSFNEADLGINVRQTAEEHAAFIKGLGAYMKSKGLKTKLLFGDTADANGHQFLKAAFEDPETWEYIGAVSFHSWRGWEKETLLEWYEAADRLDIPLIVGEGSIDAAAWRYPQIFEEPHYAMAEIKLYVRILAICQPQSILQWQLTADYSPLSGGGIFGNDNVPLRPTQRFWNLKQLSETPAGLNVLPMTCDGEDMFVTALGDKEKYAFHIVNEGQGREVILTGIPKAVKQLNFYVTDETKEMERGKPVKVKDGEARFWVGPACFVSLMSE